MATPAATITMTMREADRLKTIQAVVDRMLRSGLASADGRLSASFSGMSPKALPAWCHASAAGPATISWLPALRSVRSR
jgi:hypothetical protein